MEVRNGGACQPDIFTPALLRQHCESKAVAAGCMGAGAGPEEGGGGRQERRKSRRVLRGRSRGSKLLSFLSVL